MNHLQQADLLTQLKSAHISLCKVVVGVLPLEAQLVLRVTTGIENGFRLLRAKEPRHVYTTQTRQDGMDLRNGTRIAA